jgi:Mitochondrial carrier protein
MSPLAAATPFCALIFTINELCKRQLERQHFIKVNETTKSFITGCFSGGVGVLIYTPIEVLKCKAQATKEEKPSYKKLVPLIIKEEGYRGLYRGCFV